MIRQSRVQAPGGSLNVVSLTALIPACRGLKPWYDGINVKTCGDSVVYGVHHVRLARRWT